MIAGQIGNIVVVKTAEPITDACARDDARTRDRVARALHEHGPQSAGALSARFGLTDQGRAAFPHAYDDLAAAALRYLHDTGGDAAVADFAHQRSAALEARYGAQLAGVPAEGRPAALAAALSADGYAASAEQAGLGVQVCQHHCPVAHVAADFPQLCEAETEAFGRLLGTHVQRLATIAHGDGVCTTHIPQVPLSSPAPPSSGKVFA